MDEEGSIPDAHSEQESDQIAAFKDLVNCYRQPGRSLTTGRTLAPQLLPEGTANHRGGTDAALLYACEGWVTKQLCLERRALGFEPFDLEQTPIPTILEQGVSEYSTLKHWTLGWAYYIKNVRREKLLKVFGISSRTLDNYLSIWRKEAALRLADAYAQTIVTPVLPAPDDPSPPIDDAGPATSDTPDSGADEPPMVDLPPVPGVNQELVRAAREAMERGQLHAAELLLRSATRQEPKMGEAWYLLAQIAPTADYDTYINHAQSLGFQNTPEPPKSVAYDDAFGWSMVVGIFLLAPIVIITSIPPTSPSSSLHWSASLISLLILGFGLCIGFGGFAAFHVAEALTRQRSRARHFARQSIRCLGWTLVLSWIFIGVAQAQIITSFLRGATPNHLQLANLVWFTALTIMLSLLGGPQALVLGWPRLAQNRLITVVFDGVVSLSGFFLLVLLILLPDVFPLWLAVLVLVASIIFTAVGFIALNRDVSFFQLVLDVFDPEPLFRQTPLYVHARIRRLGLNSNFQQYLLDSLDRAQPPSRLQKLLHVIGVGGSAIIMFYVIRMLITILS